MLGHLCPKLILGLTKGRVFAMRSKGPLQASLVTLCGPVSNYKPLAEQEIEILDGRCKRYRLW
jgi:hypothetical protein